MINQHIAIQSLLSYAKQHRAEGRWAEAMFFYNAVLRTNPRQTQAIFGTAEIAKKLEKNQTAYQLLCQIIKLDPCHAKAFESRGNVLQIMGRSEAALSDFSTAISLKRQTASIFNSRGIAFANLGNFDHAIADFSEAIDRQSDMANAFYNRALAYRKKGNYVKAIDDYTTTISLNPDHFQAYNNRGLAYRELKQYSESIMDFRKSTAINPLFNEGYWNESLCLLALGNYKKGWKLYEYRWSSNNFTSPRRNFSAPLWLGKENLSGKTILLHSEQGFGDSLQFCRYIPLVEALGCKVILEIETQLKSLLRSISWQAQVIDKYTQPPNFDYHCPLMSLPLAFATTLKTVPSPGPYLSTDPDLEKSWSAKLGARKKPRVGICWRGNSAHSNDKNRSIPLDEILPTLDQNFDWVSLQKDISYEEHQLIAKSGKIANLGSLVTNFNDTAALCRTLDAILCVDTSVAHLGGALGVSTHLLLPYVADFRWLSTGKTTPWYQSLSLYRQGPARSWSKPIKSAQTSLKKLFY